MTSTSTGSRIAMRGRRTKPNTSNLTILNQKDQSQQQSAPLLSFMPRTNNLQQSEPQKRKASELSSEVHFAKDGVDSDIDTLKNLCENEIIVPPSFAERLPTPTSVSGQMANDMHHPANIRQKIEEYETLIATERQRTLDLKALNDKRRSRLAQLKLRHARQATEIAYARDRLATVTSWVETCRRDEATLTARITEIQREIARWEKKTKGSTGAKRPGRGFGI
ncbi:hypothetical protein J8273_2348 [Carpediemonas membranifera]|uniref:Uncharacterized protein n=1 Tax=Carpediemonas membranifera TaxID=201153 RepID=A0A8J6B9I1_9EUKA|nr:hypothetical protein J8273_2348 [Carpediemonas membranifera]|eukprot:KAG9395999.1 hypothetical protein J8273_2348 [Carpediemonas membranifera]